MIDRLLGRVREGGREGEKNREREIVFQPWVMKYMNERKTELK